MMKNIILVVTMLFASISFAQTKKAAPAAAKTAPAAQAPRVAVATKTAAFSRQYGMAGCGLGSVLMGKRGAQVFAATTNGTLSNQMFGISAGTLNCLDSASAEVAGRMDQFILVNRSQVQGDIARGNGETITALGSYLGCPAASGAIGAELKSNYSNIFNGSVKANEITDSIISTVISSPELKAQCNNLG